MSQIDQLNQNNISFPVQALLGLDNIEVMLSIVEIDGEKVGLPFLLKHKGTIRAGFGSAQGTGLDAIYTSTFRDFDDNNKMVTVEIQFDYEQGCWVGKYVSEE